MISLLRGLFILGCVLMTAIPVGGLVMLILHTSGWVLWTLGAFQVMLTVFIVAVSILGTRMVWDMTKREG